MTKKLDGRLLLWQMELNRLLVKQLDLNAKVATLETQMAKERGNINLAQHRRGSHGSTLVEVSYTVVSVLETKHATASKEALNNQLEIAKLLLKMDKGILPEPVKTESPRPTVHSKL